MLELGPILRAMSRNKVGVGLLIFEMAFTLMIAINGLNIIVEQRARIHRDHGIDEKSTIAVTLETYGDSFDDIEYCRQVMNEDMRNIRALDGVRAAAPTSVIPLRGGGNSSIFTPVNEPEPQVRAPVYRGDQALIDSLGTTLESGRNLTEADVAAAMEGSENVLVTRDLADALFPDGQALGKTIADGGGPKTIVGILTRMIVPYGGGPMESRVFISPRVYVSTSRSNYLIRAEPGRRNDVMLAVENLLFKLNSERIIKSQTLEEVKGAGYVFNKMISSILLVVIVLLVLVTGIGILGMTSFSVTRRTRTIGIRRALGGSRLAIIRYFLVENSMITLMGTIFGLTGAYLLNIILTHTADLTRLDLPLVVAATVSIWAIGLLAASLPAAQGSAVDPGTATRTG